MNITASELAASRYFGEMDTTGLRDRTVRGWTVTAGAQAVKFVIMTGSTAVMARLLVPEDFGLVAMVAALIGFLNMFADFGLSAATVQRPRISHEEVTGLFWFNVAIGLVMMVVIALCAPLVALMYSRPELTAVTLAHAAMAPIGALGSQHKALLQRAMMFRSIAIRDIVALAVGVGVGIAAAAAGLGYWALILMQASSTLAGVVLLWWQSGWRPGRPRWHPELMELFRFGGSITLSNVLGFVIKGLDQVLLGVFVGAGGLGIYNRAQNLLVKPMNQFLPPILNVCSSSFARAAERPDRFERGGRLVLSLVICCSGALVVFVVSTAEWIVAILLGPKWSEAVPLVMVLSLFAFVEPAASVVAKLLIGKGLPGKILKWRCYSAPIVVVGMGVGLPWGALGLATAYALSGLLIRAPLFVWLGAGWLGFDRARLLRAAFLPAGVSLAVAGLVLAMREFVWSPESALLGLAVYGSASLALYGGALLAIPSLRAVVAEGVALAGSLRRPVAGKPVCA